MPPSIGISIIYLDGTFLILKLHLVTNNPELIFARLLSARFFYLFFIYYNRYIPIPDFISFINLLFYQFILFLTGYCSFEGNMLSKNEKKNHYLLKEWKPENAAFWENMESK